MTSLLTALSGPHAAILINTATAGAEPSVVGFRVAEIVRNGPGDVSIPFDSVSQANVQAECWPIATAVSNVARIVSVEPMPLGTEGIRVRVFDVAGAPVDALVSVVVFVKRFQG